MSNNLHPLFQGIINSHFHPNKTASISLELLKRLKKYAETVRSNDITDEPIFGDIDEVESIIQHAEQLNKP